MNHKEITKMTFSTLAKVDMANRLCKFKFVKAEGFSMRTNLPKTLAQLIFSRVY